MLRQSGLVMDEESGDVTLVTASDVQVNGVEVVVPAKPARTPSLAAKRSTDDFDHQATVMGRLSPPVLLPPPVVVTAGATSVTNNDVRRSKRRKTVT